jgi:hypothetical protein
MPDGMFGFVRSGVGLCAKDDNPVFWYWIYASVKAMIDRFRTIERVFSWKGSADVRPAAHVTPKKPPKAA